jgi:hypothetical protein
LGVQDARSCWSIQISQAPSLSESDIPILISPAEISQSPDWQRVCCEILFGEMSLVCHELGQMVAAADRVGTAQKAGGTSADL